MKNLNYIALVVGLIFISSCTHFFKSGKPYYTSWKNSFERIVLLNDSICSYACDKKKVKGHKKPKIVIGIPPPRYYETYYAYSKGGQFPYKISHDTLIIIFETDSINPANDVTNSYKMKRDKLVFIKKISSNYYASKRRRLRLQK